ncbi:MAG: hypothetical protein ACI9C1_000425 [Candidatus Aldehydirespiratoraceae bacterium]|jgi:hypothetical protein
MRFIELRPSPDRGVLRLHPRITWLRGLDPAAQVAVVGMVHDVALGEIPDWDGTVEVAGVESPLRDTVAKLGETADSALIIVAASLPEIVAAPEPSAGHQQSRDAAQQKLSEIDERISGLAEELAASCAVRGQISAHLASSLAQVDADAGPKLDRADGDLGRAARLADRPDPWTGMKDVAERIETLSQQIDEYDTTLGGLPSGDRPALAAATATARAAFSTGSVPAPDAAALAQAWLSLQQRLRGLESRIEAAGGGTEAVAARVDSARLAARVAEDAAVPQKITGDEAAHLEVLHVAVIEAEQKVGRGVRRGAGRLAYDKAESALREALDSLGYSTWAGFRMGNGLASVSTEALVEYDLALKDLEVAELEWAQLMERLQRDTELQDVLSALDRAFAHAIELLGEDPFDSTERDDPDVVAEALRKHTTDAESVGVARDAGMRHLRQAMATAGANGYEDLTSDAAVVALGESWLGVLAAADELAVRILRDRERAAVELDALRTLGDGSRVDRLDRERGLVRRAEEVVSGTRDAMAEVVNSRLRLHALASIELNLAEEHDDRLVQRNSAQVVFELAERRLDGRGSANDAVALAERVPRGVAGAIPVVVVMGDASASMLDRLVAFPDDVQVLVIGDCDDLDEWLLAVGSKRAGSVEAGTLV